MQAIFYIMTNFIVGNDRDRAKFRARFSSLMGIGNWKVLASAASSPGVCHRLLSARFLTMLRAPVRF